IPELNAFLELPPDRAYAQADKIDALIAAGKPLPPLGGVPVAIKDVLSTRGITTTCGSRFYGTMSLLTTRRRWRGWKKPAQSSLAKPIATNLRWAAPTRIRRMER